MNHSYSDLEKKNLGWFSNDISKATLLKIEVREGEIRGLKDFKLHMTYPITAIAGKNGSGKTTVLALAASAFHNRDDGFNPFERTYPYYTFSDFFVQAQEEIPPQGIQIWFQILYDRWTNRRPRAGPDWQARKKRSGGKWNKYASRVSRNVVFLGLERVVPHSEKSVSKSYKRQFRLLPPAGIEDDVKAAVGRILNRDYGSLWFKGHSKYRLPMVTCDGHTYSGYNMGAGENALINILATIYSCQQSLLLVIDEIELGLHEEAQIRLVRELNKLCSERHLQVICTTHSPVILKTLPPEGRFYLEKVSGNTTVYPEISPDFASGKLSGNYSSELDIFVEDDMSRTIVNATLDRDQRARTNVTPIGSSNAVILQMCARYKESDRVEAYAYLDGDMREQEGRLTKRFLDLLERPGPNPDAESWISKRLRFLPGDTWPENWVLSKCSDGAFEMLAKEFGVSEALLSSIVQEALMAGKHNEFRTLSNSLAMDETTVRERFTKCAVDFENTSLYSEIAAILN